MRDPVRRMLRTAALFLGAVLLVDTAVALALRHEEQEAGSVAPPAPLTTPAGTAAGSLPPGGGPLLGFPPVAADATAPPPGSCHPVVRGVLLGPDPVCTPGVVVPLSSRRSLLVPLCGASRGGAPDLETSPLLARGYAPLPRGSVVVLRVPADLGGLAVPGNAWPVPSSALPELQARDAQLHEQVCRGIRTVGDAQRAALADVDLSASG